MIRLNQDIRSAIVTNAVAMSPIPKRKSDLKKRRAALAEELRLLSVGGKTIDDEIQKTIKKIKALMEKVPEQVLSGNPLFRRDYDVGVNVGGQRRTFHFNGDSFCNEEKIYKIVGESYVIIDGGSLIHEEILAIDAEDENIQSSELDLRHNVRAMVDSFKTVEALIKAWPECEELIPRYVPHANPNLPAVIPEQLNKLIGLPSEKK
jgi:hypothetical protein